MENENIYKIAKIRRCRRCILPETMPFIKFDNYGICNYCNSYKKIEINPKNELDNIASEIRSKNGEFDCIVMFSGGRDSSYLLHYVVTKLKLHPIAFTYDWGMTTPVCEKNAERMCNILGVKRIVVNKDAKKKIENVRKNILAWIKKPELGMIPLLTAGDKEFFSEVNSISKKYNISTIFIGTNPFEKTDFKTGFCNIKPNFNAKKIYSLSLKNKIKMVLYYIKCFILNPSYINSSLFDTMKAFISFYGIKQNQIDLYKYIKWNEKEINDILINTYGWQLDEETPSTWRIGDGTAAFYNYVYYTVAGFTENDTFRSNQIREGDISRDEALKLVSAENKPRIKSMEWYFNNVNVNMHDVIEKVNKMKKKY